MKKCLAVVRPVISRTTDLIMGQRAGGEVRLKPIAVKEATVGAAHRAALKADTVARD
jgi:hypothetical protein